MQYEVWHAIWSTCFSFVVHLSSPSCTSASSFAFCNNNHWLHSKTANKHGFLLLSSSAQQNMGEHTVLTAMHIFTKYPTFPLSSSSRFFASALCASNFFAVATSVSSSLCNVTISEPRVFISDSFCCFSCSSVTRSLQRHRHTSYTTANHCCVTQSLVRTVQQYYGPLEVNQTSYTMNTVKSPVQ